MPSTGARFPPRSGCYWRGDCRSSSGNWPAGYPMNPDFVDLLQAFAAADVRFLIVGAYALAHHGRPRATGDLDIWIDATPLNAPRVMRGLAAFGAPTEDITALDFARPGIVFQIGVPPGRLDILTPLTRVRAA